MKLVARTNDGRFEAEFEGTFQEVFEQVAEFHEVFGENQCVGPDGKVYDDVVYKVRTDKDDNKYYEKVCMNPGEAKYRRLAFGCNKKGGGLFPKRRDADGKFVGWNGWGKYNKETGQVE
jgi:hypothetical protein